MARRQIIEGVVQVGALKGQRGANGPAEEDTF